MCRWEGAYGRLSYTFRNLASVRTYFRKEDKRELWFDGAKGLALPYFFFSFFFASSGVHLRQGLIVTWL